PPPHIQALLARLEMHVIWGVRHFDGLLPLHSRNPFAPGVIAADGAVFKSSFQEAIGMPGATPEAALRYCFGLFQEYVQCLCFVASPLPHDPFVSSMCVCIPSSNSSAN